MGADHSGYLSVWQIEKAKNPWQYDLALMDAAATEEIAEYCWSVLANEDGSPNRYIINRGTYSLLARRHNLNFFAHMADLYEHLATLHRQRVTVAAEWLEAHGHLHVKQPTVLLPHSAAWFAALEVWEPAQAMMTRRVIQMTGRTDICSVCGDDPVKRHRNGTPDRRPIGTLCCAWRDAPDQPGEAGRGGAAGLSRGPG
ncbi:hypothetical protein PUR23_28390 [Methylorubrum populi]|uniref:hypothetical protein n=1 Tax=Methylorubrum populi TaxID=223967 RepID=UPI0031F73D04